MLTIDASSVVMKVPRTTSPSTAHLLVGARLATGALWRRPVGSRASLDADPADAALTGTVASSSSSHRRAACFALPLWFSMRGSLVYAALGGGGVFLAEPELPGTRHASTCLTLRAPTIATVIAGCRSVQAIATSPGDRPCRAPMAHMRVVQPLGERDADGIL